MTDNKCKNLVLPFVAIVLSGCVSTMNYPDKWSGLIEVPKDQYGSISGRYNAVSDPHPEHKQDCSRDWWYCKSLADIILNSHLERSNSMWVNIHEENKVIEVTIGDGEKIISNKELKKDEDYEYEQGVLIIKRKPPAANLNVGVGISNNKFAFYKAKDGALVMHQLESGVFLLWIPPFVVPAKSTQWWRWETIKP